MADPRWDIEQYAKDGQTAVRLSDLLDDLPPFISLLEAVIGVPQQTECHHSYEYHPRVMPRPRCIHCGDESKITRPFVTPQSFEVQIGEFYGI